MDANDGWHVIKKGSTKPTNATDLKQKKNVVSHREKADSMQSSLFTDEMDLLNKIRDSPIYERTRNAVFDFIKSKITNSEGVVFSLRSIGVGSMTNSIYAYIQTSFAYLIQEALKEFFKQNIGISVTEFASAINDPIFTDKDLKYISEHGMIRIENDNELMSIRENEISIFFMPHCEKELYAKVVDLNSKYLNKMCIIGNSFQAYIDKVELIGKSQIFEGYPIIKHYVQQSTYKEEVLPDFKYCYEAFNNTCFITF